MTMHMEERAIMDFLYYGYVPNRNAARYAAAWYHGLLTDPAIPSVEEGDFAGMRALFQEIVAGTIAGRGSLFRAGVSSGYDSRLILAALSHILPQENLFPFTNGTPGNKDISLAPLLLKGRFENYRTILSQSSENPTVIMPEDGGDHHALWGVTKSVNIRNKTLIKAEGPPAPAAPKGSPTFNGYLGDPLAGSHLGKTAVTDLAEARASHARRYAQHVKGDVGLPMLKETGVFRDWYDPQASLADEMLIDPELIEPGEQMDLFFRQFQYIRMLAPQQYLESELALLPADVAARLRKDRDAVLVPFADPRWIKTWLKISRPERLGQKHYKKFLAAAYPEMFEDLLVPDDPRWAEHNGQTNPDWAYLWENSATFQTSIREVIEALANRDLWFDPRIAFEFAESRPKGYARLLQGLCALEQNFRLNRLPAPGQGEWRHVFWG